MCVSCLLVSCNPTGFRCKYIAPEATVTYSYPHQSRLPAEKNRHPLIQCTLFVGLCDLWCRCIDETACMCDGETSKAARAPGTGPCLLALSLKEHVFPNFASFEILRHGCKPQWGRSTNPAFP